MLTSTSRTPDSPTTRTGTGWTLALLITWLATAASAHANVVAELGSADAGELPIGSDLWVTWPDAPKDSTLTVTLVDSGGFVIVQRTVETDDLGWAEPKLLWTLTGVRGCDVETDEGMYRYPDFEDALVDLLGDTLSVEVDGHAVGFDVELTRPIDAIYYFSDIAGCPRGSFARTETQYVSAWTANGGYLPEHLTLFLEREGCPKHTDVRAEPQEIEVPSASRHITREIGTACELGCGSFVGWIREAHGATCFDTEGDPCGPTRCVHAKGDIAVHAVGADAQALGIQSKGRANADWDDGQCDLCDDADQGGG